MEVIDFCSGLGVGLGIGLWGYWQQHTHWKRLIALLPPEVDEPRTKPDWLRIYKALQSQVQLQQALQQTTQNWQIIFEAAPIGYIQVDARNCLTLYNAKAAAIFNIEASKASQLFANPSLLHVIRSYELDRLIKDVRHHRTVQPLDWTLHQLQGNGSTQDIPVRGYGFLLSDGAVGVFLEDRWEPVQLIAERDRWTSDVAHELKTPLTSIRLIAETVRADVPAHLRTWVDRLIQEATRLGGLVQDILELSQMTFNFAQDLPLESVNLSELVQQAWISLEPLAQSKNLSLYYGGPDALWLQGHRKRLYRVFINLIDNAIKFSPVDGAIAIEIQVKPAEDLRLLASDLLLEGAARWVVVDVIDQGAGFPQDSLSQVFKRFYRADAARVRPASAPDLPAATHRQSLTPSTMGDFGSLSTQDLPASGGSGLGLAIVQQIITAHRGSIRAQNHPRHGGGWIQIYLPLQEG